MISTDFEHERETDWNEKMIGARLRALAANLLRITRGSGKLYEVEAQVMELANELAKHHHLTSHAVSPHVFREALIFDPEICTDDKEVAERQKARAAIVQGALQFAAAEMLDQNTFRSAGDDEISEGLRMWEAWRKKVAR